MTSPTNVVGELYKNACRLGESNLKLQREILLGLTRVPTTLPDWLGDSETPFATAGRRWVDAMNELAESQRSFLNAQFETALKSLDAFTAGSNGSATSAAVKEEKPAAAKPARAAAPAPAAQVPLVSRAVSPGPTRNIAQKVAVVTGAASGIGEAVSIELARRGAKAVIMVDRSQAVLDTAKNINSEIGREVAISQIGDTTDAVFRKRVFEDAADNHGIISICVPAAGITRDALSVRLDKETGRAQLYPLESFRQVTEVNLIAPIYWAIEMVGRIAEDRKLRGLKRWEPAEEMQGTVVFLGSVSSQGNKGQISYAVAKAGLEGAAATLMKEAIFHGVRCGIIHPGFTDTPMARALGEDFLNKYVLPFTQLRRLIRADEIADAICFMISNSAVSGELWADAGWHPPA